MRSTLSMVRGVKLVKGSRSTFIADLGLFDLLDLPLFLSTGLIIRLYLYSEAYDFL